MLCTLSSYKKVELNYRKNYSEPIKIKCPFCRFDNPRTKTYGTLKQLVFHLSDQHKDEGNYYPFTITDIKTLMQMIALAKEWGLLDS